jgi:hypothetical protein
MMITSEQIRAARAMLRWEQKDLAENSKVSLPSIKRLELIPGVLAAQERTGETLRAALETAGVIFVEENGEGPVFGYGKPKAEVREKKSGFRVEVPLPDHPIPHILKGDFQTEEGAKAWAESSEGQTLTAKHGELWWQRQRE